MQKRYELNTAALTASPRPTAEWVPCQVHGRNTGGQYYVTPEGRLPRYVFANQVREVRR